MNLDRGYPNTQGIGVKNRLFHSIHSRTCKFKFHFISKCKILVKVSPHVAYLSCVHLRSIDFLTAMSVIGSPRANAGSKRLSANLARSFLRFQKMQSVTPTMINTPKAAPTTPPMMGIMLGFLPGQLFTCRKKSGVNI